MRPQTQNNNNNNFWSLRKTNAQLPTHARVCGLLSVNSNSNHVAFWCAQIWMQQHGWTCGRNDGTQTTVEWIFN